MRELDKLPPQDLDVEKAILGALLLDRDSFQLVSGILKPHFFYKESHSFVYQAVCNLQERGSAVDMLTATQELKRMDVLEECGGAYEVSLLTSNVAASTNIEYHAQIIVDKYIRRYIIQKASEWSSSAFDEAIDIEDITSDISTMESVAMESAGGTGMKLLKDVNQEAIDEIRARIDKVNRGEHVCIDTPLQGLNNIIGGFMQGQFVLIAARPGDGKTSIALAFAKHQAESGFNPAIFSLEMKGKSLSMRLFCVEAGVDSLKLKTGDIHPAEFQRIEDAKRRLDKLNIQISDEFTNTVPKIKALAKKLISKGKCDIIYIDYLQLMDGDGTNRQEQVSKISRETKKMAEELDVPVVAMAQLARASEQATDKRPKLTHLRESGSLEQDADTVIFLFRPAKHNMLDDDGNPYDDYDVEIIVDKQRDGATGKILTETNKTRNVYYDKSHRPIQEADKFSFSDGAKDPFGSFEEEYKDGSMGGNLFSD